jgi:L-aspartate oxidase
LGRAIAELQTHLEDGAALVVWLIARCALAREESRGAHFRPDFPEKSARFASHSTIQKDADVTFR